MQPVITNQLISNKVKFSDVVYHCETLHGDIVGAKLNRLLNMLAGGWRDRCSVSAAP